MLKQNNIFFRNRKAVRVVFLIGIFLAVAFVLTPYPRQFLNHVEKIYSKGINKFQQYDWVKLLFTKEDAIDPPVKEAEILSFSDPPPPESSWSWPSFFKSEGSEKKSFFAAKPLPPPPSPYPARTIYPIPQRLTLSHIEGNNFTNCFATNYTQAQILLAPEYVPGKFLPQIDLQVDRFDDTTYAASGGLVIRYIPKKHGPVNRIFGFNGYYDYRQGNIGYFNQFGGGIEILGKRWDFRANVYVPMGGKRKIQTCVYPYPPTSYEAAKREIEQISFAYNAEVGWLAINSKNILLYLAGGPYYIAGRTCFDKTRGGEFRIQPQYKEYIALNAIFSYDPLFNAVYQFEVIVNLPFYLLSKKIDTKETCGLTPRQIYQPVIRFDVMPIARCACWMFNWDDLIP